MAIGLYGHIYLGNDPRQAGMVAGSIAAVDHPSIPSVGAAPQSKVAVNHPSHPGGASKTQNTKSTTPPISPNTPISDILLY